MMLIYCRDAAAASRIDSSFPRSYRPRKMIAAAISYHSHAHHRHALAKHCPLAMPISQRASAKHFRPKRLR